MLQLFLGRESNFDKQPANRINSLGSPYDPISIMHYTTRTFANSDLPTMVWRANPNQRLGGRELSTEDINQINKFYNCPQATTTTTTTTTKTTTTTTTTSTPSTVTTSTTTSSPTTTTSATSTSTPSTVTASTTTSSTATTASVTSTSTPSTVTTSTTTTSTATTASATSTSTPSTVITSTTAVSPTTTASATSTNEPITSTVIPNQGFTAFVKFLLFSYGIVVINRSSHWRCSVIKVFLEISQNS